MNIIFSILIIFILINSVLKLSFWKLWQVAIFAILMGIFVFSVFPFAVEQSQVTMQNALENPKILSNMAVLVSVESGICICFCFLALRKVFLSERKKAYNILKWYPSLLVLPVLFYLLAQAFFYFSGVDFSSITLGVAIVAVLLIVGGAYGIRWLFPEEDFRLEVHFLTSLFIAVLGLISTANGNIVYVPKTEPINFSVLGFTFLLFVGMFAIGFLISKLWWRRAK